MSDNLREITVLLPKDLLVDAQEVTGESITATIELGLNLVVGLKSFESVQSFKGLYKPAIDLSKLRDDS